jgi:hypothetical protein
MTNQRILRLQQSIREDLIKKRDMGLISLTKPPKSETESTEESSVSQREKRPKRKKHQNPVKLKSEERNQESNGSKKMLGEFVVPTGPFFTFHSHSISSLILFEFLFKLRE